MASQCPSQSSPGKRKRTSNSFSYGFKLELQQRTEQRQREGQRWNIILQRKPWVVKRASSRQRKKAEPKEHAKDTMNIQKGKCTKTQRKCIHYTWESSSDKLDSSLQYWATTGWTQDWAHHAQRLSIPSSSSQASTTTALKPSVGRRGHLQLIKALSFMYVQLASIWTSLRLTTFALCLIPEQHFTYVHSGFEKTPPPTDWHEFSIIVGADGTPIVVHGARTIYFQHAARQNRRSPKNFHCMWASRAYCDIQSHDEERLWMFNVEQ